MKVALESPKVPFIYLGATAYLRSIYFNDILVHLLNDPIIDNVMVLIGLPLVLNALGQMHHISGTAIDWSHVESVFLSCSTVIEILHAYNHCDTEKVTTCDVCRFVTSPRSHIIKYVRRIRRQTVL